MNILKTADDTLPGLYNFGCELGLSLVYNVLYATVIVFHIFIEFIVLSYIHGRLLLEFLTKYRYQYQLNSQ